MLHSLMDKVGINDIMTSMTIMVSTTDNMSSIIMTVYLNYGRAMHTTQPLTPDYEIDYRI